MQIQVVDKNRKFLAKKEFEPSEDYLRLLYNYEDKLVHNKLEDYKARGLEAVIDSEHQYLYELGDQNLNIMRYVHVYENGELLQEMNLILGLYPLPILSSLPSNLIIIKI